MRDKEILKIWKVERGREIEIVKEMIEKEMTEKETIEKEL
jgi:hypothetical protein